MEGVFVAYYRVSTGRQGKSGLGLEAQQKAVTDYLNGGSWTVAAEFTEIETGKKKQQASAGTRTRGLPEKQGQARHCQA